MTWYSFAQDGSSYGIYAQRYDADGNVNGAEFQVNTYTSNGTYSPDTTALADGGFVVTWESPSRNDGIYAQRYDASGNNVGTEFQVNTYSSDEFASNTTALADGGFVIAWSSYHQDGSGGGGIYAQRYDSEGNPLGTITFNANPSVTSAIQDQSADEDTYYSFDTSAHFNDIDISDTLTYTATLSDGSALPIWLSINPSTGVLSGTPTPTDSNALNIKITATDNAGASVSNAFLLTVNDTILAGTTADDNLIVTTDTISVRAGTGNDTAVFSGNYANYTFSQSDSFVPLITHNSTGKVVSLHSVEKLQFDDVLANIVDTGTGGETRINFETPNEQYSPKITTLSDGSYVVIFEHKANSVGDNILARHYDSNGNAIESEFQVITITKDNQQAPDVTALTDGGFVATWHSSSETGYRISAQKYNANGDAVGDEFQVNTTTTGNRLWPSVSALSDGGFVVVWDSSNPNALDDEDFPNGYDVVFQRFDGNVNKLGEETKVDESILDGSYRLPHVDSSIDNGNFVITWKNYFDNNIYMRIYDEGGNAINNESKVSNNTPDDDSIVKVDNSDVWQEPKIAFLNDGSFVITWHITKVDQSANIYARHYDSNGAPISGEFIVNSNTEGEQSGSNITSISDGGYVIVWSSSDGSDIFAQRYDSEDNVIGNEFLVTTYTSTNQYHSSVASLNDGGFIVSWASYEGNVAGYNVFSQRYDAEGNPLGEVALHIDTPALASLIPEQSVNEEIFYSYSAAMHFIYDSEGDSLVYSAALADGGALPYWLSINTETGLLSGVPIDGENGNLEVTVTASNIVGDSAFTTFTLTINDIAHGTSEDDNLLIQDSTVGVLAGTGTDTAIFSGNYADYTFSQSASYVSLVTHNTTGQVVSLFSVERLEFDDLSVEVLNTGSNDFQVNIQTENFQSEGFPGNSSITALTDGGFVITWQSYNQDGSSYDIYAKRYDVNGNENGAEFQVNTYTYNTQSNPSTTALNDGGFVIAWTSYDQDGGGYGIYAQRYESDGTINGDEFQVNTYTSNHQNNPSTTALNDGGFVITWHTYYNNGNSGGLYAQRFNSDSTTNGDEFQVNTYTTSYQKYPNITTLNDGGFIITWESNDQDGSDYGIYAQRFNSSGDTVGDEFKVNTNISGYQQSSSVAAMSDDGFVITWHGYSNDDTDIYARIYDANGDSANNEFKVNSYTTNSQQSPSITSLNDDGFVIIWESYNQYSYEYGIYGQRYDSNGNSVDDEFQVNNYVISNQVDSSVVATIDGGFVVTWDNGNNIYAQRYDSEGVPLGDISIDSFTFIIRESDGNTDINLADIITDFTDGEDLLGGAGDIDSFDQLTVAQGTGDYTADTVISLTTTGEILAVLDDFTATNFDANDFVQLDIV